MQNQLIPKQYNVKQYDLTLSMTLQKNIIDNALLFHSQIVYCRNYRVVSKVKQRFAKRIFLIPSHLQNFDAEDTVKSFYSSGLPSWGELDQEVQLRKQYWSTENDTNVTSVTSTLEQIAENHINQMFSNITRIFTILSTASAKKEPGRFQVQHVRGSFQYSHINAFPQSHQS